MAIRHKHVVHGWSQVGQDAPYACHSGCAVRKCNTDNINVSWNSVGFTPSKHGFNWVYEHYPYRCRFRLDRVDWSAKACRISLPSIGMVV